jgi:5-methyltetrahydrofolate--homocysteine methyltransferase
MSDLLSRLLADKPVLIADGAMGTSLFDLGLETGDCPELWNVDHPDRVVRVHRSFVEAGSDIILTNTFGGNRRRLMLHDAQDRVRELCIAGARIARQAADGAGRPVVVAGSMGPTGDILQPVGSLPPAEAEAAFAEQAMALAEGGCDVLWIETISSTEELAAAVAGAAVAGLPIVATLTFDTNGRTMMGVTAAEAMALARRLAAGDATADDAAADLVAVGANCGIGPPQLLDTILRLASAAADAPAPAIVAKGNCGIPKYVHGHIHYDGTPEIMADYARLARDAGARIIGGCCGTTAEHVRAMVEAVTGTPPGPVPDRATVEARLGPIAAPAPGPSDEGGREGGADRRSRRRRRAAAE